MPSTLLCCVLVNCCLQVQAGESANEAMSVEAVLDGYRQSHQSLESLHVKTRVHSTPAQDAFDKVPIHFGKTYLDEYAFSSFGQLFRLRRAWRSVTALKATQKERDERSLKWQEERLAYDGQKLRFCYLHVIPPEEVSYESANTKVIDDLDDTTLLGRVNIYNEAIGCPFFVKDHLDVWTMFQYSLTDKGPYEAFRAEHPYPLEDALQTGKYSIAAGEVLDGIQTVLVSCPGWDKVWLAPSLGFAIIQRELFADQDKMFVRFKNSEHEEIAPGVWLPKKVQREIFGYPSVPDTLRDVPHLVNDVTVVDFLVNNVSDDTFVFDYPAGADVVDFTHVKDNDGTTVGVHYVAGADSQSTQISLDNAVLAHEQMVVSSSWQSNLLYLNVVFVAILVIAVAFRVMQHRKLRSES